MKKSELIALLNAIDGDPHIFIDVDGKFTDEIDPFVVKADARFNKSLMSTVTTELAHDERVILI